MSLFVLFRIVPQMPEKNRVDGACVVKGVRLNYVNTCAGGRTDITSFKSKNA